MTIMQVVGVTGVNDGHVAAGESVLMCVLLMVGAFAHRDPPGCKEIDLPFRALSRSEARLTVNTEYVCAASRTIPVTLIRCFL